MATEIVFPCIDLKIFVFTSTDGTVKSFTSRGKMKLRFHQQMAHFNYLIHEKNQVDLLQHSFFLDKIFRKSNVAIVLISIVKY